MILSRFSYQHKILKNTKIQRFTESYAKTGVIGMINGSDVLKKTLEIMNTKK